ncbi:transcriptional regulator [Stutzerimonas stutzeri]|nr:transcriptional regulator [Stutzerimonas stutzeri]AZO90557.1 transcriptional regulator [Stutzerimonas stutzeri]
MASSSSSQSMQDFSQNLRLLCGYYKSVAKVCRSLDINRQQFNKYLGAQATPSSFTLRKICTFFGVDEDEIFSEHESFRALLNRQRTTREPDSAVPADFFPSSAQELSKYQGYYFVYLMSPSAPGEVIKSITRLTRSGEKILSKTYERMRLGDDQLKSFGINKYRGFCFASSDLIYIVEREYLSSRGYIWSAIYPSYRSRFRFLNGLVIGVSGDNFRRPFGAHIVFEHLGESIDLRNALTSCSCFPIDAPEIPNEVRARLLVHPPEGEFNLVPPLF